MIIGVGIDQIEVERVRKQVENTTGFRERVFAPEEIAYCESKRRSAEHYAARWAAKEAFFKALGTGWREGMEWPEVLVTNDAQGKPSLLLRGRAAELAEQQGVTSAHVSLSHLKDVASAIVILETS